MRKIGITSLIQKCLLIFHCSLFLTCPVWANNSDDVDRIIVSKSDRQLYLMSGETIIRTYPISLGKNPEGHKTRQGDQRTPEGRYFLDWRNPESQYYLAMHISYPNHKDLQYALKQGISPGNNIMLHGLPNKYADGEKVFLDLDWTDGCIAVSNEAIEEIWHMVADNTVIDIIP